MSAPRSQATQDVSDVQLWVTHCNTFRAQVASYGSDRLLEILCEIGGVYRLCHFKYEFEQMKKALDEKEIVIQELLRRLGGQQHDPS